MRRTLEIMDTTLRDGEQTSGVSFTSLEKLTLAKLLLQELKVDRIEIASARVSDGEFNAVKEITSWASSQGLIEAIEVLTFVDNGVSIQWMKEAGAQVQNLLTKGSMNHLKHQLNQTPDQHFKNISISIKKAEKEGNQELIDNAQFTIKICTIIAEESAKNGPIKICEYLGVEGIDQELQQEIDQYMETGKSDLEGISAKAVAVLKPYRVQLSTKGFNAGFALLSAVAKTAASAINEKPEFSKGALLLLNQSSIIQIYTKMNKKGEDAVLTDFKSVYPPNFQGELKVDGGKNYYSSRVGGKMAFYFS